ncbi:YceI family protein [Sphingomonas bacterium]|uniref:YceI family protein n=1 Tax=Sphingomonas bacterium TaxID=1895847 RepID=UPI001576EF2A|nr:YceI family protein [Sphingomonas bacterium]
MRLSLVPTLAIALAATAPALAQLATTAAQPGAPIVSRIAAGTYQVDPAHTQVAWEVNHMGFSMLSGMFGAASGSITIDPAHPAAAKVAVTFQVDQLAVTSAPFAHHLMSNEIFDAAKYPTASFVSTSVTPKGADQATIVGNLTIKGITKPVTLEAKFVGAGVNPMNKKLNFGFTANGIVKRSDFGVGIAAPYVSDTATVHIHAAFVTA